MALIFKFGADGSAYSRGLDKMRSETKAWSSSIRGMVAGAFGGAAIIGGLKSMAEHAKEVNKQAKLFGTNARVIQQFGAAAEQSGFTLENLADAMHDMTEKAQDAANGNQNYADAFKMMNLEAEDFMNMNFEEKVHAFGDGLKFASEKGLEFLAANELAGGAAQELIGTFKDGGDAFFRLAEGMNAASEAQIQAGLKLNKVWGDLKNLAVGALSAIFQGLLKIGAISAAAADTMWIHMSEVIKGLGERFGFLGDIIKSALTGDLDGVKDAFLAMGGVGEDVADRIEARMKSVRSGLKGALDDINGAETTDSEKAADKNTGFKALEALKAQKKIAEEIAKLHKEVADADEKAAFDALNHEEKKLAMATKRAELEATMAEGAGKGGQKELDALKALKQLQQLEGDEKSLDEKEGARVRKAEEKSSKLKADALKMETKVAEDAAKTKADLDKREAEIEESNALSKLSDPEKLKALKNKQAGLLGGTQEDRIEGKGMQQGIDDLARSIADNASRSEEDAAKDKADKEKAALEGQKIDGGSNNLIASSIQSIGGGGGISMLGDPQLGEAKKANEKLDKLIENTTPAGGAKEVEI